MKDKLLANMRTLASMTILVVALAATAVLATGVVQHLGINANVTNSVSAPATRDSLTGSKSNVSIASGVSNSVSPAPAATAHSAMIQDIAQPLQLGTPLQGVADDDPIKFAAATSNIQRGKLVYAAYNIKPPFNQYLALRTIGPGSAASKTSTYPLGSGKFGLIFEPQFSPSGRYVLLKRGSPFVRQGKYQLYVLDLQTNQLKLAAKTFLKFRLVYWSPDSNYLAYIVGGDADGGTGPMYGAPLQLYICNWRTGQEHLIIKNGVAPFGFAWAGDHTLFYSVLTAMGIKPLVSKTLKVQAQRKPNAERQFALRPDIYQISAVGGPSKLLVQDGYRPMPSPDGKWIAFFGSSHPEKPSPVPINWEHSAQGMALSVVRNDGSGRVTLNSENTAYPVLRWMSDSNHFLTIKTIRQNTKAEAHIAKWDVSTGEHQQLGVAQARDDDPTAWSEIAPQFRPAAVSKEGQFLFLLVTEFPDSQDGLTSGVTALKAIDLHDGNISTLTQVQGVTGLQMGVDWCEEPINTSNAG